MGIVCAAWTARHSAVASEARYQCVIICVFDELPEKGALADLSAVAAAQNRKILQEIVYGADHGCLQYSDARVVHLRSRYEW